MTKKIIPVVLSKLPPSLQCFNRENLRENFGEKRKTKKAGPGHAVLVTIRCGFVWTNQRRSLSKKTRDHSEYFGQTDRQETKSDWIIPETPDR
mmetsp:Transcript_15043/g.33986  ORF Transcript_15043/g.33986 Transcript_15043/m.33986 type:complete len:93 (+) Transcript_15043:3528-3806(+)